MELYDLRFERLDTDTQYNFLKELESENLPAKHWDTLDQGDIFRMMIGHAMQGFYGAPRHGGNKNYMSYKMMELDFPLVVGRNHYEPET